MGDAATVGSTKVCSRCNIEKGVTEFYANSRYAGGYTRRCRECVKDAAIVSAGRDPARRREIRLNWNMRNQEQKRAASAARRIKLKDSAGSFLEKDRCRVARWRVNNPIAAARSQARSYRKRCQLKPEKEKARRALAKGRMLGHPIRSIAYRLSATVRSAIRRVNAVKTHRTVDLIGCTIPEFMEHIAGQFQPGMSWGNWGFDTWHLDHKRPVSSFDLTDAAQQRACFHFSNYQPLWMMDNIRKGASIV